MAFMTNQWLKETQRKSRHLPVRGSISVIKNSTTWGRNNEIVHSIKFRQRFYRYECPVCEKAKSTSEFLGDLDEIYCDSCESNQQNWKNRKNINYDLTQLLYLSKSEAEDVVKKIVKIVYFDATSDKKMELIKLLAVDSPEEG
jgi:hypothetical protein